MNRYGKIAQRHWARWLPRQYAAISDPESFFTTLGEEVARQIDDLTDELVGEIKQSDSYLAHVGRLFAARAIAEELIVPQRVLPDPELVADDQDNVLSESGKRPVVVDRDHTFWAEVNAEQQERIHGPATGLATARVRNVDAPQATYSARCPGPCRSSGQRGACLMLWRGRRRTAPAGRVRLSLVRIRLSRFLRRT